MATLLRRLLQHKCPKTALGIGLHEGQFGISAGAYLSESGCVVNAGSSDQGDGSGVYLKSRCWVCSAGVGAVDEEVATPGSADRREPSAELATTTTAVTAAAEIAAAVARRRTWRRLIRSRTGTAGSAGSGPRRTGGRRRRAGAG